MITYLNNTKKGVLKTYADYQPNAWVNVTAPTADELSFLEEKFKIDIPALKDALDPTMVPRIDHINNLYYMYVRYPQSSDQGFITLPLLFVASPNLFVTISQNEVPFFKDLINTTQIDMAKDHPELGLIIFNIIGKNYEKSIESIGRKIEAIRSKLRGQIIEDKDFANFVIIEGELNEFLTIMRSTSVMLKSLAHFKRGNEMVFGKYPRLIESSIATNERSISNCELYEKSINSIRDAYSTLSSNKLNQTMKVLTVATLFVAIPTSVFSMYGMNVGLPIQSQSWAFAVILVVSVLMPVAILIWAKKRRLL